VRQTTRIARGPRTIAGKPPIRAMPVTVGAIVDIVAAEVIAEALSHARRPEGRHAPATQRPMTDSEP
jgi:uncharacterized protein (DUF433 family)